MDEKLQPRLGVELRKARMRQELTQEQVAHAVGFVPTVYGRIERGDMVPSASKLRKLCAFLGVSADVLLSLKEQEESPPPEKPREQAPDETPEFRRLVRTVNELSPQRFRLFRVALQALIELEKADKTEKTNEADEE